MLKSVPLMIPPPNHFPFHLLFHPDAYPSTTTSNLTVSFEELTLSHSPCCALSRLPCNEYSTFLLHIFTQLVNLRLLCAETMWFQITVQDIFNFVLDFPALDSLRLAIFDHSITLLNLWSLLWIAQLLGLFGADPCLKFKNGPS